MEDSLTDAPKPGSYRAQSQNRGELGYDLIRKLSPLPLQFRGGGAGGQGEGARKESLAAHPADKLLDLDPIKAAHDRVLSHP